MGVGGGGGGVGVNRKEAGLDFTFYVTAKNTGCPTKHYSIKTTETSS